MLSAVDWLALFGHFLLLSLLSIGGAITVVPDMHRVLVCRFAGWADGNAGFWHSGGAGFNASGD